MKGKDKCEILKKIRSDFAQKNGIDYSPSECNHDGDCCGVCPKCEEEAEMLLKKTIDEDTESVEIVPLDGTVTSNNLLFFDGNSLMIVDDETTPGLIAEDEVLGGDIMFDDNENEDIVDITDQDLSLDYFANDENNDSDYV